MAGSLYTTLKSAQGFLPLYLHNWRLVVSNEVPVIAVATGNGGNLAVDTSPKLIRVNAATDKCLRIVWIGGTSIEIFQLFHYPPDMDVTATYSLNFLIGKSANGQATCAFTADLFEGVGDTTRGGTTAVLGASAVTLYTKSITPTAGHPDFAVCVLTPGTHATDDIWLYEAYVLYTKKFLTS